MRVTVEYFGPAREAVGHAREVVEVAGGTARDLVAELARSRGGRLARLLLVDERLSTSVLIAVGDRQATVEDSVELRDGDEVAIIPPVSGGTR